MTNENGCLLHCSLLIILVICFCDSVYAQTHNNLRFERFTIENGLSSDRIRSISQDHLGYIWLGTEAGISRYDGYNFALYLSIPGDMSTITDNVVNVIFPDSRGQVWVGTNMGLNLYNPVSDSFKRIYHQPDDNHSLPGHVVSAIFESSTHDLWIGTNNGLSQYDRTNHSFVNRWQMHGEYVDFSGVEIISITEDSAGTLWIGSANRGLIVFNPKEQTIRFFDREPISGISFPSNTISKVIADSFGNIWIGFLMTDTNVDSINGLGRYHPESDSFTLFRYDPEKQPEFWDMVSDIHQSDDGTIWVTTYLKHKICGLHRFDKETEKFTTYSYNPHDPSSLTWPYATAVFEDRFNNLWVGTSRGLNKADRSKWQMRTFKVRPDAPELLLDNYYGIVEVSEGVFWLGLDGPGLIEWDRNTGQTTHFSPNNKFSEDAEIDITFGSTSVIKKDLSGEIWIGYSSTGLARVNMKSKQVVRYLPDPANIGSLSGSFVTDIMVDKENNVWITTTNGLNKYNRDVDSFITWTVKSSGIISNSLSTIFQDSRGVIWLGTEEQLYVSRATRADGLIRFDPVSEVFTGYRHDPDNANSLSSDAVRSIVEDDSGNLWIGTKNGLNRFDADSETFEQFHVTNGLPDPVVVGLLFDDEGMLWISTMKGLSRFNPHTRMFRNFDKSDGVQENRFNIHSYYKTRDGELIFGGIAGANYFHPSEVLDVWKEPLIHLTSFLVNNSTFALQEPLQEVSKVELRWNENSLGFGYTAINFRSPELTVYEYKLVGYDNEWISSGTRRFVNYTNLPPGDYEFSVRALNAEGVSSKVYATLAIRIKPPVWKTFWAYLIYGLLLMVIVLRTYQFQKNRTIRKERERAQQRELEHAREIEKAYKELKSTQTQLIHAEKMASLGQLTAGIAHEIQNPLNFVNNFSEVSAELIDEMREELNAMSTDHVGANNYSPSDSISQTLDDIKENLEKINHHGKRAESIVKAMLQHSRSSTGQKEPTDINALADEYLRLAYHGMRAKYKGFNAEFKTEFDPDMPLINLVPQEMGRVLLNLINNAFQAVAEKSKTGVRANNYSPLQGAQTLPPEYIPTVTVTTKNHGDHIEIRVADNGNGIPDGIKDKIFQPFFTTKPTGQGTGLGLSLSYDIVKAHGGSIEVESKENAGTAFVLQLIA